MKPATFVSVLAVLAVAHVAASPADDVLTPTGMPATSGLPFSTLSFDTTAAPSVLSALSSLISSESTAITPPTTTHSTLSSIPSGSGHTSGGTYSSTPTTTAPATSASTVVTTPVSTSGARRLDRSGVLAGVGLALGAVAALV